MGASSGKQGGEDQVEDLLYFPNSHVIPSSTPKLSDTFLPLLERTTSVEYSIHFIGPPRTGKTCLYNQIKRIYSTVENISPECRKIATSTILQYFVSMITHFCEKLITQPNASENLVLNYKELVNSSTGMARTSFGDDTREKWMGHVKSICGDPEFILYWENIKFADVARNLN
jgi:GTPase SAR1 family protein